MLNVSMRRWGIVLLIIGVGLIIINAALVLYVKKTLVFGLEPIRISDNFEEVYFDPNKNIPGYLDRYSIYGDAGEINSIKQETSELVKNASSDFDKAVILREWVRRQVTETGLEVGNLGLSSPVELLKAMQAGKSASCGPIAKVYLEVLHANGIPAREIDLCRNPPFDIWDTHVTVEAFLDGKWVLQDPTFNMCWKINGAPASAWEIREYVMHRNLKGSGIDAVNTEFIPTPSIDSYYKDPFILFNNLLYIYDSKDENKIFKYTPLRLLKKNIVQLVKTEPEIGMSPFRLNSIVLHAVFLYVPLSWGIVIIAGIFFTCKGYNMLQLTMQKQGSGAGT